MSSNNFKYSDVEVGKRQPGQNNMSCKKAPVGRVRRGYMKLPETGSRDYF